MGNHFWIFVLLLSSAIVKISKATPCLECAMVKKILDYYPEISVKQIPDESENCSDPCSLKSTLLPLRFLDTVSNDLLCAPIIQPVCTTEVLSKYRSIDGSCNNLVGTYWAMAGTCQQRFLETDYADGKSIPRKSCLNEDLPNARVVSKALLGGHKVRKGSSRTTYFMIWGQVVSHDVTFSQTYNLPERGPKSCCYPHPRVDGMCIAVKVPANDTHFKGKRTCLSYRRTLPCQECKLGIRRSSNKNTGFFDLSIVYGSSKDKLKSLRTGKNGMLRTQDIVGVGQLPPPIKESGRCRSLNDTLQCFDAGDERIAQNPLLALMQVVLLRNHNVICQKLQELNPHWNDDHVFNEARRINIAQAQMITYGDYLKHLLGPRIAHDFELDVLPGKSFTKYKPLLDATTWDEFASAAGRFGHALIPNILKEADLNSGKQKDIFLHDYFFWPFEFYSGQIDRLANGMTYKKVRDNFGSYSGSVSNCLNNVRNEKKFEGSDLSAMDIVRTRDHAHQGYTEYIKFFFDVHIRSFCDLKRLIHEDVVDEMKKHYKSVHDIELIPAGMKEHHSDEVLVGPLFAAILVLQYRILKFGDRYYFEHGGVAGSFEPEQLEEIKMHTSLARILCDTTNISRIQPNVFLPRSKNNKEVSCDSLPEFDLKHWKDDYGLDEVLTVADKVAKTPSLKPEDLPVNSQDVSLNPQDQSDG